MGLLESHATQAPISAAASCQVEIPCAGAEDRSAYSIYFTISFPSRSLVTLPRAPQRRECACGRGNPWLSPALRGSACRSVRQQKNTSGASAYEAPSARALAYGHCALYTDRWDRQLTPCAAEQTDAYFTLCVLISWRFIKIDPLVQGQKIYLFLFFYTEKSLIGILSFQIFVAQARAGVLPFEEGL